MYNKIFTISLIINCIPYLRKQVLETVSIDIYLICSSIFSLFLQIFLFKYYNKDSSTLQNIKKPKNIIFMIISSFSFYYASYINDNLMTMGEVDKINSLMQASDLVITLILGLLTKDIKKVGSNRIKGLILFLTGIYYYNKNE